MKKTISGLLALLLLVSVCAGCGSKDGQTDRENEDGQVENQDSTRNTGSLLAELAGIEANETVLEMDGTSIPADMVLYWLVNTCSELEYQLKIYNIYYGLYGEVLDEDSNILWDQSLEGEPLADMVREEAENSALSYALMENVAKANNVALTAEDQAELEEVIAGQIEQAGGEEAFLQDLYEQGLSFKSYKRILSCNYLYQRLVDLAADPSSEMYKAPGDDDAYVDHILLTTADSATGEPLSDEDAAAKKAQAEDLLAQLEASDDLEALFTEFADTYGEDPGRATDAGYLIDPDTNFVQEFKDAAFALKPGEISGIVESSYGYHILLRKELTADQLRSLAGEALGAYLDARMETALAGVVRTGKLDGVNVGEIYNSYVAKLQELHPELVQNAGEAADSATE